jgi:flagellar hook-length control protein FliK
MFDHVKVNQSSIINLLKNPERENSDILSRKPGNDFYSMVMENKAFNDYKSITEYKPEQISEPQKYYEKIEPVKNEQFNTLSESSRVNAGNDRESNSPDKGRSIQENSVSNDMKNEVKSTDTDNNKEIHAVKNKDKKNEKKSAEDEDSILDQLNVESNIKNLMEIIRAAFSGNKKAEEESFQKLFSNLKSKQGKDNKGLPSLFNKNDADKNQKAISELVSLITKDLKDAISKELFKNTDNRKPGSKHPALSDKELKDLASSIIDGIKKNKSKDIVKHELKTVFVEEVKNDKKTAAALDQQPLKKIETAEDSSFEKNSSKEKNSGRENFSYNGGKIDFSAKSGLERMEHALKASDFKENLQEIIDKSKVTVRDSKNGAFTVRLNPQELGNVNVNLIMENGVITGKFLVDNEDVKSMLLSSLNDLKYQLEEAGIAVGEFSVNVSDQREKYLKQKDDESVNPLSFLNSDRDLIAAADQYDSAAMAHNGHINMVI